VAGPALRAERVRAQALPKAIIDFANTRGADKILYAGYYPMGITLERIFQELPDVPFRDHVWRSSCARTRCACSGSTRT